MGINSNLLKISQLGIINTKIHQFGEFWQGIGYNPHKVYIFGQCLAKPHFLANFGEKSSTHLKNFLFSTT